MDNKVSKRFEGNYGQWLVSQMQGWSTTIWGIFWFGVAFQLALFLTGTITLLATITMAATFFGLLCVCAMAEGKEVNGLLGLISAVGYIYVNYSAGHYASVLDQVIFAILIDIPLLVTWRTWGQNLDQKIRRLGLKGYAVVIPAMAVIWFGLFHVYTALGDTSPLWDSLVLTIGATASILVTLHFNDSYSLWLAEDAVNCLLWLTALQAGYSQSSLPMLVVTLIYTATAIYGKFGSVWSTKHYKEVQAKKAQTASLD